MSRAYNICSVLLPVLAQPMPDLPACGKVVGGHMVAPGMRTELCGWCCSSTSLAADWVSGGHAVTPSMRMALQMKNDPRERAAGSRLASSSYGGNHIIEACLSTRLSCHDCAQAQA